MSNNAETLQEDAVAVVPTTQLSKELVAEISQGDTAAAMDFLDDLEANASEYEQVSTEPDYKEFAVGEIVKAVFLGFKVTEFADPIATAANGGKPTKKLTTLAIWAEKTATGKKLFVHAGTSLVRGIVEGGIPLNAGMVITQNGTAKTNSGQTVNLFKVDILVKKK